MKTAPGPKTRKAPVRRLFTRRTVTIEGKPIRFELRKDGIHIRRKHSRKIKIVSLPDLFVLVNGQKLLPL